MSKNTINFQDVFLNLVRKENRQVYYKSWLTNFQLKGYVKAFDNFVVILENELGQQMIYKHAISTISPMGKTDVLKEIHSAGEEL
jgi:host factor-I protein